MIIVVDTNIVFSALLNSSSTCGEIILNLNNRFELYSCSCMLYEITKHWEKVRRYSKFQGDQLRISYGQILSKLKFIKEDLIPYEMTGDKVLYNGLKKQNFKSVINTTELLMLCGNNRAN